MAYWCDDYGLYLEQRRLDEEQRRAALAIEARQGQDAKRLDPKDESLTPQGVRPAPPPQGVLLGRRRPRPQSPRTPVAGRGR